MATELANSAKLNNYSQSAPLELKCFCKYLL